MRHAEQMMPPARWNMPIAAGLALLGFVIDAGLASGAAAGFLQVAVMLLGFRLARPAQLFMLAGLCSGFIVIGHVLTTDTGLADQQGLAERILALALVWLAAATCRWYGSGEARPQLYALAGSEDNSGLFFLSCDPAGPAILNSEARRLLGLQPDTGQSIFCQTILDLIHPDDRGRTENGLREAEAKSQRFEIDFAITWHANQVRYLRAVGRPVAGRDGATPGLAGALLDVTELKRAEVALQEREARLRSILETAPEAIITINDNGIIESFSTSAEALFGYRAEEVIGTNVSMLMPAEHAERHDQYLARYRETGERRIIGIGRVVEGQRKDGTKFPMELGVGEVATGQRRIFTGFIRDLTTRQRLEQELRQSQKMEAIGQLTGGVAHDFNNLLTVIMGNLEMLMGRIDGEDRPAVWAREAYEAAESGSQLTQRLLAFGRRQPLEPRSTDLADLVKRASELLGRTLGEAVAIKTVIAEGDFNAMIDASQLQNALLNIAINARDAMPGGGDLTIDLSAVVLNASYVGIQAELPPGRYGVIAVTDTGTGMRPDVQEKVFEPFFTTKPVGAGSGLGLSMVYGFVKQTGGHVQIYSEPGRGTTVRIYLPLTGTAGTASEDVKPEPAEIVARNGETILVVEDDARVRRVTAERLAELGYEVLEANDGPSALELLADADGIDLLLSDMVMPGGMNGAELADIVRASHPAIRVLLTSGYAEPDLVNRGVGQGTRWLRKPHSMLELAAAVREVLDAGPAAQG